MTTQAGQLDAMLEAVFMISWLKWMFMLEGDASGDTAVAWQWHTIS